MNDSDKKRYQTFKNNYSWVIGASKNFNPEVCEDINGKPNPGFIADLPLYHRTPVAEYDKQPDSNAEKGVAYCDRLFHFEKKFALLTSENRLKERERLSRPMIDEFYNWIEHLNALPKTLLNKAAYYAQSQRKYLERYLLDGRLEISNNRAERSIKPFVIGRKNWLFSNTPNGARASAVYYSLVVTARENGLNLFEYLAWIFTNAPNLGKPGYVSTIEDFLPGSAALPQKVFTPNPKETKSEKYAWEED